MLNRKVLFTGLGSRALFIMYIIKSKDINHKCIRSEMGLNKSGSFNNSKHND